MQQINARKEVTNISLTKCSLGTRCLCCKHSSPIILSQMISYLDKYPDTSSASVLREGFSSGFKLGYLGARLARDSPNQKSINQLTDKAIEKLEKEINLGHIAGPFRERPLPNLIVSPIGPVPKAEPGKFRLIQHLSFPEGNSIN